MSRTSGGNNAVSTLRSQKCGGALDSRVLGDGVENVGGFLVRGHLLETGEGCLVAVAGVWLHRERRASSFVSAVLESNDNGESNGTQLLLPEGRSLKRKVTERSLKTPEGVVSTAFRYCLIFFE